MPRPSVEEACRLYEDAKQLRTPMEEDWKMSAAYCTPWDYKAWNNVGPPIQDNSGREVRRWAYDNTGVLALPKYVAIMQRLLTPDGQRWSTLKASEAKLMNVYAVRAYFDELNDTLFKYRYNPNARFVQATTEAYETIGVYGNGPKRLSWRKPAYGERVGGFMYKAIPMRDFFVLLDDDGNVWCTFVRFYLTAPQFKRKWPNETMPKSIATENGKALPSNTTYFEFVHMVCPRDVADYDPSALNYRRYSHISSYICIQDKEYVGKEEGYKGNPYIFPRAATPAGGAYGISPAQRAMPALGGASATKKTLLKQGQKAVDPVILANDDGVLSGKVDLRPGHVNYGGVDGQGRRLIYALEMGDFNVGEKILEDERLDIGEAFLTPFFKIIEQHPEMTAAEVFERIVKETALVAPTMGRMQSEDLGPSAQREIDMLAEYAPYDMPEMPPELVEAQGQYEIVYTSPTAKNLYAEEDAGFVRMVEMSLNIAQATGSPEGLDHYNMDVAIPEIAVHRSVPTRWMNDQTVIDVKRAERQKQQATDQLIKAGPSIASVATATMKNNTGGIPAVAGNAPANAKPAAYQ